MLFPLLGLMLLWGLAGRLEIDILLGLFLLTALPSTVSSSVALVGVARGNVPAAVFNASLSGLAGVVLTPLLVSGVTTIGGSGLSLGAAIIDVAMTLLLPFAVGQAVRPLLASRAARFKRAITRLDRGVILLIIYGAFSRSTAEGLWARTESMTLAVLALIVLILFAVMMLVMTQAARAIRLSPADQITAVFCGSQKSLANGAPLAAILFADHPSLGIILMPTLLYHQLQLLVGASLARRYAEARIDMTGSDSPPESGALPVSAARSTQQEKRKTI
jgi:sodium/bile acid cotransporter 7